MEALTVICVIILLVLLVIANDLYRVKIDISIIKDYVEYYYRNSASIDKERVSKGDMDNDTGRRDFSLLTELICKCK